MNIDSQFENAEDRVAVLLSLLDSSVADEMLGDLRDSSLRERIEQIRSESFDSDEIEQVLEEFMRFFRFATEVIDEDPNANAASVPEDPKPKIEPFTRTDDAIADLKRLKPFQVAGALKQETPRTIALVISKMNPNEASQVLGLLPEELQSTVFIQLRSPPSAPDSLVEQIVRKTVEKGCLLDEKALVDPEDEIYENLAGLLRGMEAAQRLNMMQALFEKDPDAGPKIKEQLYRFEDIPYIADTCVQKLLVEIDSLTLATSLKDADQTITDKFLTNLSKRAKASLMEEIEYLGQLQPDAQKEARHAICDAMAELDGNGELIMERPTHGTHT